MEDLYHLKPFLKAEMPLRKWCVCLAFKNISSFFPVLVQEHGHLVREQIFNFRIGCCKALSQNLAFCYHANVALLLLKKEFLYPQFSGHLEKNAANNETDLIAGTFTLTIAASFMGGFIHLQ